jgi:hypothetical protein
VLIQPLPAVLHDDQQRLFDDVSRFVAKPSPEVAIFDQGGISFPVVASQTG